MSAPSAAPTPPPAASPLCSPSAAVIAKHSHCPKHTGWIDEARPLLSPPSTEPLVLLNVGANKGYELVSFLRRWAPDHGPELSERGWHQLMRLNATPPCQMLCCGICSACRIPQRRRPHPRAGVAASSGTAAAAHARVEMHAFELVPSNAAMLASLVTLSGIPATVHALAVTNQSGSRVWAADSGRPGFEATGALRHALRGRARRGGWVRTVALDDFIDAHAIRNVTFLSVDTEGWDGLVLRGAARALSRRAVALVEFEYIRRMEQVQGPHALRSTVEWLGALGYTCFYQDYHGHLARASAPCWRDEFAAVHPMGWTNLVCAHQPEVVAIAQRRVYRA